MKNNDRITEEYMRFRIGVISAVIALTMLFAGCDFRIITDTDYVDKDGEKESVLFFGDPDDTDGQDGDVKIEKPESQKGEGDRVTSAGEAYNSVTEVYHAIADSVVEITTEIVQTSLWGQYVSSGAGSGVIIEKSGIIVTNYHVIEGARTVTVRLTDGSEYSASLVGYDSPSDLAVIKINAQDKNLTVASLGCSADLEVGEDVVALGNPLGSLGGTLTTGIISAKDRVIEVDGNEMVLLQTNAAINPGNSGGGLFNMAGQLIGVVNAKISQTGIEGLGFAIPIDVAHSVVIDLIEYGYVRGVVSSGLTVLDVTAQNRYIAYQRYGISTIGVVILDSANTDELKLGDKIISIDGIKIETSDDITLLLKSRNVGDTVTVRISRNGTESDIPLKLTEQVPDSVKFD
jgi:serine protease Do